MFAAEFFAVFSGRHTGKLAKNTVKIHFVFVAEIKGYFFYRFVGFYKHICGGAYALLQYVLFGRNFKTFCKDIGKVSFVKMHYGAKVRVGNFGGKMFVYIFKHGNKVGSFGGGERI